MYGAPSKQRTHCWPSSEACEPERTMPGKNIQTRLFGPSTRHSLPPGIVPPMALTRGRPVFRTETGPPLNPSPTLIYETSHPRCLLGALTGGLCRLVLQRSATPTAGSRSGVPRQDYQARRANVGTTRHHQPLGGCHRHSRAGLRVVVCHRNGPRGQNTSTL